MNQVTEQATPAIVAMSLSVNLQELVRIMASGLEMHQLVKVSPLTNFTQCVMCELFFYQYAAPICLISLMGE